SLAVRSRTASRENRACFAIKPRLFAGLPRIASRVSRTHRFNEASSEASPMGKGTSTGFSQNRKLTATDFPLRRDHHRSICGEEPCGPRRGSNSMRAELLALLAASWAQEAFGVWKLNPARSTPVGNQRCITPGIGPHIRGEVFTLDTVTLMLARQHPTRSR